MKGLNLRKDCILIICIFVWSSNWQSSPWPENLRLTHSFKRSFILHQGKSIRDLGDLNVKIEYLLNHQHFGINYTKRNVNYNNISLYIINSYWYVMYLGILGTSSVYKQEAQWKGISITVQRLRRIFHWTIHNFYIPYILFICLYIYIFFLFFALSGISFLNLGFFLSSSKLI